MFRRGYAISIVNRANRLSAHIWRSFLRELTSERGTWSLRNSAADSKVLFACLVLLLVFLVLLSVLRLRLSVCLSVWSVCFCWVCCVCVHVT